jgi:hypothetical protein
VRIPREEIERSYQMLLHYAQQLAEREPQLFVA